MSQIMWKEGEKYKGIINIMGGFHIFLVTLKILCNKYGFLGLRGLWVRSKIVADGSVNKALEERHYSRRTQLHKETFEALVHFKCKSLEKDFEFHQQIEETKGKNNTCKLTGSL